MNNSTERLPNEEGRPVTPLEASTQEIIGKAVTAGLENRVMLPDAAGLEAAEQAIGAVAEIDFDFDARHIRSTKTCQETAEMIAETLAPSIETAYRFLVSPDFYRPLDEAVLLFERPFEAKHPPTGELVTCGGAEGRRPLERHLTGFDEHNRLTSHVVGKRLGADGSPAFIEFNAWTYAPESSDYVPAGGLHSRFFHHVFADGEPETPQIWQEVSLYGLRDWPQLRDPANELYRLKDAETECDSFFLRVIAGRPHCGHAGSYAEQRSHRYLGITRATAWRHRPSMIFAMYEGLHADGERYGFDVTERSEGSWMYQHCAMNHPGYTCSYRKPNGCECPEAA